MLFNIFGSSTKGQSAAEAAESAQRQRRATAWHSKPTLHLVPIAGGAVARDFKVTYMNEAGAGLLNRSAAECRGVPCYELFRTTHCRTAECRCARRWSSGMQATGETVATPGATSRADPLHRVADP